MKTHEQIAAIEKEVKGLDYYELCEKFELLGKAGAEDYRHYFFKYDDETIIEFHDRADTTVTQMTVEELIEYYAENE